MKTIHLPQMNIRYWLAITMASVFGTNLGDLYAHESGLGIVKGLAVLAAFAAIAFLLERRDDRVHAAWYWLAIVIIRTGATNIADFLAFRVRVPGVLLGAGLVLLLAVLGWMTRGRWAKPVVSGSAGTPDTHALYWAAMLTAGVLGTVLGDDASHAIGQGWASVLLGGALALVLVVARGTFATAMGYWAAIGLARTAGTAMGDWLAENHLLNIGLPLATLITGMVFVIVAGWPRPRPAAAAVPA
ncbi:hypothetical protein H7F51_07365 [Novosphingobium flavum]|uniref:Membrane-anchored protein n=1 Tax=Novosphingobium flavum TaxID=1778672 RepID=A0A7X1FR82_9SPHN|nr:hypothetical protein [Novosphingobium flavum]MBC2665334.1 hypothetical protein [Novosphingobium flavum]